MRRQRLLCLGLTQLESRFNPASLSDGGTTTLTITLDGQDDLRLVSVAGGTKFQSVNSRIINAGVRSENDFSGIGTQIVTLTNLNRYETVNIVDAGGGVSLSVGDSGSIPYRHNLNINFDNSPGRTLFQGTSTFGDKSLTVESTQRVAFVGAVATTTTGNITLTGNRGATPTPGDFQGVQINSSRLQATGSGQITLRGQGGSNTASTNQSGVIIHFDSQVIGGTKGTLTIDGIGGSSSGSFNHGVVIRDAGSRIDTAGANVLLTGSSRGFGAVSESNMGVYVVEGATVTAGGSGTVFLRGTGGDGFKTNYGVIVEGEGSLVTSSGGDVTLFGIGGGNARSTNGFGVGVQKGATVTGGGNATVRLEGQGNLTPTTVAEGNSIGVWINGYGVSRGALVTSGGGDVILLGKAGVSADINSKNMTGLYVFEGAHVEAGGNGSVTITGYGGTGIGQEALGVRVEGTSTGPVVDTRITSNGGPVTVTGFGGDGQDYFNTGVQVVRRSLITAGGNGKVTIKGFAANNSGVNVGVSVEKGSQITTSGGDLDIEGVAGRGLALGFGVYVHDTGLITAGGNGNVNIVGRSAETKSGANAGVTVGANSSITSGGGTVTVDGSSAGIGQAVPSASSAYHGVYLFEPGAVITSGGGNVTVTGKGGDGVLNDVGVFLSSGSVITAGGARSSVTVTGYGGTIGDLNDGVRVSDDGSEIRSAGGAVTVIGFGGAANGLSNFGVELRQAGRILAEGNGAVTVLGTAGGGTTPQGVHLADAGTAITSAGGDVLVSGRPGAGGGPNDGVLTRDGAVIAAGGSGGTTIDGTGALTSPPTAPPTVPPTTPPPAPPAGNTSPRLLGFRQFAAGAEVGPTANLYDPNGTLRYSVNAFGNIGSVRTAAADFNSDGIADLIVGTGPGVGTSVTILDGVTQQPLFGVQPFENSFAGGVFVAAGDITGDNIPDLIVTPDEGGGPVVVIYDGALINQGRVGEAAQLYRYFGIEDPAFRGGARAAAADINGDGKSEVVVAAGFGGGPRITVWDGARIAARNSNGASIANFFAFETALRNGAYVASGDVDGDGRADLIFGGGPGGGPRVRIFDGPEVLAANGQFTLLDEISQHQFANFFAGNVANRGGVRVSVKNLDNDNRTDLVVGAGTNATTRLTTYPGVTLVSPSTPPRSLEYEVFPGNSGGIYVG